MDVSVVGLDLAAQPAGTGAALGRWDGGRLRVDAVHLGVTDEQILEWARPASGVGVVAIDAPFGWPFELASALAEYAPGRRFEVAYDDFRYRLTDRHVRERVGRVPLSVSSDRIALCTLRVARLLAQMPEVAIPPTRPDGAPTVIEVYPAATLAGLGVARLPYKVDARAPAVAMAARRELSGWLNAAWADAPADVWQACHQSSDVLDAVLCALTGGFYASGSVEPPPPGAMGRVQKEGWIYVRRPDSHIQPVEHQGDRPDSPDDAQS